MSTQIKYRHPLDQTLEWSGKGKAPKWYDYALGNGFTEDALLVENQTAVSAVEHDIDLGIGGDLPGSPLSGVPQRVVVDTQDEQIEFALPEAGQQQLQVCLQEFGFQALTAQEFIQAGVEELNHAVVRACRAGVAFWAAQEAIKTECAERTGAFLEWIDSAGLTKERVYECIRIAKFYSRLTPENRAKALIVGKKHALLLASLPQEVIDQAAESGNDLIDKADMMTVAELKEEIRRLERIAKNLDADIEIKDGQIKRLSQAKVRTTDFLLRTEEIREESMALQLGAELSLNSIQKLFVETDIGAPEGDLQTETLWIAANTIAARALDLLEYMKARVPEGLPDRPMTRHLLTPEEAIRWMNDYPLIENRFAAEQSIRQDKRDAAKPKGPGRPRGSINKAAEG